MPTSAELDAITIDQLRSTGATKWNRPDGAIGAFTAEMDYGADPAIVAALHREVDASCFGYLPPKYLEQLREAQSEFVTERYGWSLRPEWIHPLPSVVSAFEMIIDHFTPAGSPIIVPTPAYMPFISVPPLHGREVIEVRMLQDADGFFRYDLDGIDRAFAAGARLLVHCDPHNPTGRVMSQDELEAISEVVARHDGRVFSDEIWAPLTYEGQRHIPYASISEVAASQAITAMSASKGWNIPGLKCAQIIFSHEADEKHWDEVGRHAEMSTATLGLVANAAAYADGTPWITDVISYLEGNAKLVEEFVAAELPGVTMPSPEGTYVAWLDVSALGIEGSPAEYFLKHAGVLMTDGAACGEVGRQHLRLIFSMPRPILRDALERIAAALPATAAV